VQSFAVDRFRAPESPNARVKVTHFGPEPTWPRRAASKTMKLFNGIGVTLAIAIGAYLTGVNILHPWQGFRLTASSDLEFWIAIVLMTLASAVCAWRLLAGSKPKDELRRFGGALTGPDDQS
jgi:hypothetical protein